VVGLLFVSPLSPEETSNDNSRRKHDDNDRWNTHPVTADKVSDLRNMFQGAYTGWLEIYEEAA
jgi:hypothetical protein